MTKTLSERDNQVIWHPYTQHKNAALPYAIKRGQGAYLFDEQDRGYLDLTSSWWVNIHGHGRAEIAEAIYEQALTLEHIIFAGFTHEPAVLLAENVLRLLPPQLTKVFYSENGSCAVEIALKMAYQYWRNVGEPQRNRFITFQNSYHGDTFGCMSIGKSGFFGHFEDLFFQVEAFNYPATWLGDDAVAQKEAEILQKITTHLEQHGAETAALIIEPLVQGVSGMQMCRPQFLQELEKLIRAHGVLIIYDEVMTGFGRTGKLFACEKASTTPDIICLAKGLSGGFLPLAITACQQKIFDAFLGDNFKSALAHGHSFTANPLCCAASLASLQLLQKPETLVQMAMIEKVHHELLGAMSKEVPIERLRYCGTIAAFDLKVQAEYGSSLGVTLREAVAEKGVLIRPLGNTVYFIPPYCITEKELRMAYEVVVTQVEGVSA